MALKTFSRDKEPLPLPRPTGGAWHNSSRLEHTQAIRKALAFQLRLENAVHDVARLSQTKCIAVTSELQRLGSELAASSAGLHDFFSDFASTALHNELRRDDSCPARRVFDIAEIVEMILGYLDPIELLQALEVDRTMHQTIESSPMLQEKLFLRPAVDGPLHVPFLASQTHLRERCRGRGIKRKRSSAFPSPGFPSFTCQSHPHPDIRLAGITAKFSRELPRIGSRCRSILVCQPPIYSMGVYPLCCSANPYTLGFFNGLAPEPVPANVAHGWDLTRETFDQPFETLTSESGITVGDLYDMTVKTRKNHERCPWAPASKHTDDGVVFTLVSFGGAVKVRPTDPAINWAIPVPVGDVDASHFPLRIDLYSDTRPDDLLERYATAKRRAFNNGEPRPSFQEFKDGIDPVTGLYPGEDDP